ncbi:MAG: hypothetical protein WBB85_12490 [Albidovulum sp.]|uniref:hypothetical protein n=1 Tax=Albidovulum sp. TaxID=1872424 RepID=UPI003C8E8FC9
MENAGHIYFIAFTGAAALALLLAALREAFPIALKKYLPIGGSDFKQTAILVLAALALATFIELYQGSGRVSAMPTSTARSQENGVDVSGAN